MLDTAWSVRTDFVQEEQCCEAALSFHTRGEDTFWTDRMSEAPRLPEVRGQKTGVSGDNAFVG